MKITLEKEDLAIMLGKAMGYEISPDDMEVKTEPFEVVLRNIRKTDLADAANLETTPAQEPVNDKPSTPDTPFLPEDQAQKAIAGLQGINAQLTQTGGGAGPVPPSEAPMFRNPSALGPDESYDPNFDD